MSKREGNVEITNSPGLKCNNYVWLNFTSLTMVGTFEDILSNLLVLLIQVLSLSVYNIK